MAGWCWESRDRDHCLFMSNTDKRSQRRLKVLFYCSAAHVTSQVLQTKSVNKQHKRLSVSIVSAPDQSRFHSKCFIPPTGQTARNENLNFVLICAFNGRGGAKSEPNISGSGEKIFLFWNVCPIFGKRELKFWLQRRPVMIRLFELSNDGPQKNV